MGVTRYAIPVTTTAGGAATESTEQFLNGGDVVDIYYEPSGTPLDTGADITVTIEGNDGISRALVTKADIGTSKFTLAPRQAVHAVADGSGLEYTTGEPVVDSISVVPSDKIQVVVANGGNALSGTFYVTIRS